MEGVMLLAGGAAVLSALGALESRRHRRLLRRIPIRIHVNGTRGKSSVTRLIAAGLRAGGIATCAKTTGTLPRMIFPDGREYPVFRPGRSNIIEQLRVVRAAAEAGAEALVIECMALHPHLQSTCELDIVKATHGVITNARADHLDVMGPTPRDVAVAMSATAPVRGKLFTAEQKYLPELAHAAHDRRSRVVAIDDAAVAAIHPCDLNGFSHIEHADNVALALAVCADVGIDRQTALRGMWGAQADVGALGMYRVQTPERQMTFVNGFAANDPDSTGRNWNMIVDRFSSVERRIAVFNCRTDRADRSIQLADACLRWKPADQYLLIGAGIDVFAKRALHNGMNPARLIRAERQAAPRLIDALERAGGASSLVMGMGNIAGPGMELVKYFRERDCGQAKVTDYYAEAA